MGLHATAEKGFTDAAAYDHGRPGYADAALTYIRDILPVEARVIADVGAGTGKLTRSLLAFGTHVIAVEPIADMRAKLVENCPACEIVAAPAEALPFADASIDAVTCAAAFHWFEGKKAAVEFARVLKPNAPLVLIWNDWDESVPWISALCRFVDSHQGDTPGYRDMKWKEAFVAGTFIAGENRLFPWCHLSTFEQVVARIASISYIAAMPERDPVITGAAQILRDYGHRPGETVSFQYKTMCHVYRKSL